MGPSQGSPASDGAWDVVFLLLHRRMGLKFIGKVTRFQCILQRDKELSVGEQGSQTRRATAV